MADTEIWKDIEGYKGLYQVSSLGRVRSLDREIVVLRGGNYYSKTQKGCIITNQKDTSGNIYRKPHPEQAGKKSDMKRKAFF